jgi:cytochrome c oxidase subunit 1
MSNTHDNHDAVGHHEEHAHHEENFVSKYIFSMDHKMIAKQFLITGIIMGTIGMLMSLIFRLQLAYPDTKFAFLNQY